jgi:hypothetical protein
MPRNDGDVLFVFPALSSAYRLLLLELGHFLSATGRLYEQHFLTELQLCREAVQFDQLPETEEFRQACKILPFHRAGSEGPHARSDRPAAGAEPRGPSLPMEG